MEKEKLNTVRNKLRERLSEYRYYKIGKVTSIHINAIEMSLCLVDYVIENDRKILDNEKRWFEAGWQLSHVLDNSEWEDLLELYFNLKSKLEELSYL